MSLWPDIFKNVTFDWKIMRMKKKNPKQSQNQAYKWNEDVHRINGNEYISPKIWWNEIMPKKTKIRQPEFDT